MASGFPTGGVNQTIQQGATSPGFLAGGLAPAGAALRNPALDITLRFGSPISSALGSPRLYYSQVLTATTIPMAGLFVLVIDFIVQLAVWVFGEDRVSRPTNYRGSDGTVTMSLSELAAFLKRVKSGTIDGVPAQVPVPAAGPVETRPGVIVEPPQPMTILLLLNGTVTGRAGAPIINLTIPVITFPGITGGLPILIMGLIATILVRGVVPPSSAGIIPPADPPAEPKFQMGTGEILNLLQQFGKYFK